MAMRPRGGAAAAPRRGARAGGVRAVYEDFRPVSEWKQDDESHILNIYLPGFRKEQIRVSTEGRDTLKVRGERLVAGNKWSRFLEDFQVPENGEMNSVRAKFQGVILNITVPMKHVDKPQETLPKAKGNDVQNSPTGIMDQDKVVPKDGNSQPPQETLAPKPKGNDVQNQPTIKDQDKPLPEVRASQPEDERSTQQQKTSTDPSIKNGQDEKRARDQNGDQRDTSVTTPFRNTGGSVSRDAENEISESKKNNIASDRPDDLTSKTVEDRERKKNGVGTKELPDGETPFGREGITEMKADRKLLYEDNTKHKYKKAVEGLAELNEERQLLVNMGAAMLVIVALTAYVTYKIASGNDKN